MDDRWQEQKEKKKTKKYYFKCEQSAQNKQRARALTQRHAAITDDLNPPFGWLTE